MNKIVPNQRFGARIIYEKLYEIGIDGDIISLFLKSFAVFFKLFLTQFEINQLFFIILFYNYFYYFLIIIFYNSSYYKILPNILHKIASRIIFSVKFLSFNRKHILSMTNSLHIPVSV